MGQLIEIRPDKGNKGFERLVGDWSKRASKLTQLLAYTAARAAKKRITARIPDGDTYARYRASFRVAKVKTGLLGGAYYSVYSSIKPASSRQQHRDVDTRSSVVYVTPNQRRLERMNPGVVILQQFNPWTMGTLPFVPDRKEATLIVRAVSAREQRAVEEDRKRDESKWRPRLLRVGVRPVTAIQRRMQRTAVRTVPDLLFAAARLELGSGAEKPRPHWKPGIEEAVSLRTGELADTKAAFERGLGKYADTAWKRFPPRTAQISPSMAKSFVPWQNRLGVRIG